MSVNFILDYAFLYLNYDNLSRSNDYELIYAKLITEIRKLAESNYKKIKELGTQLLAGNSETLLCLLTQSFIIKPEKYIQEVFDFTQNFIRKKWYFKWRKASIFCKKSVISLLSSFFKQPKTNNK